MKTSIMLLIMVLSCFASIAQDYTTKTLYTPNNTAFTAYQINYDMTQTQKDQAKSYWLNYYNNRITFLDAATYKYNCHSFAWNLSEGGPLVWIGYFSTGEEDIYWTDGSYVQVSNQSDATKVSFASDDHSAITTTQTDVFISKWGPSPLFKHSKNDCPYNNSNLKYYRLSENACRKYYTNQSITQNTTKTGCALLVKNVSVSNNASMTFDITDYVKIYGPFTVQPGSTLTIK